MDQTDSLKRILYRERAARKAAEEVIETKSLELYLANQELLKLNESLEERIRERTAEIEASRQELIFAKNKAEAADRSKSEFLSNMSHEIRTPLNSVIGLTELIVRDSQDPTAIEYARSIQYSAENLLVIINEILDFSKIESGKLTFERISFPLAQVAESLMATFRPKAEAKNVNFRAIIDPHAPEYLIGDPVKLSQILINLVGNALKFTASGYVHLLVRLMPHSDGRLQVWFGVEDTGIGIPAEKQARVFESFEQANASVSREFGGTGLGLAITRRLVELQGGHIWVESEEGKGSCFQFVMPFEIGSKGHIKEQAPASERDEHALSRLRVLLVEDLPMNQFLMKQVFRRKNITADVASNGREAIEKLCLQTYDVVLMDLHMPVMDGREATRLIRQSASNILDPNVYIIALTADAFQETRREVMEMGMNDFLSKPVRMEELYDKLSELASLLSV